MAQICESDEPPTNARVEFRQSWDDINGEHHEDRLLSEPMPRNCAIDFALFLHHCVAKATPAPNPNVQNHRWEIGTV